MFMTKAKNILSIRAIPTKTCEAFSLTLTMEISSAEEKARQRYDINV